MGSLLNSSSCPGVLCVSARSQCRGVAAVEPLLSSSELPWNCCEAALKELCVAARLLRKDSFGLITLNSPFL